MRTERRVTTRLTRIGRALGAGALGALLAGPLAAEPTDPGYTPPAASLTVTPNYPAKAMLRAIEGHTVVCFRVTADGRAERADIVESTHRLFRKPSVQAVRASIFEPARQDGTPVVSKMCRTYYYRLDRETVATR